MNLTPEIIQFIENAVLSVFFIGVVVYLMHRQKTAKNGLIGSLRGFNDVRHELERVIADFVAGIVPWLAGVPPAYLSAKHAYTVLELPLIICIALGFVVEGVAFANVATYTEVSQFQREKEGVKKYEKGIVPKWNIVLVIGFYLVIVITMNGILGFFSEVPVSVLYEAISTGDRETLIVSVVPAIANSIAILLISLLTIPGAATISLRLQHRQFVEEKTRRKPAIPPVELPEPIQPDIDIAEPTFELTKELEELYEIIERAIKNGTTINKTALANLTGVSRPTIYNRIAQLEKGKLIKTNSKGEISLL